MFIMSNKEYAKLWRERNPEKKKMIQKRSMFNARMEVLRHYSGKDIPDCRCCGETIFEFLHVDHKDGNGADHRREIGMAQGDANNVAKQTELTGKKPSIGGNGFIYWLKRNNYPEGLQILCANCNSGKRSNKYCPHEIIKGYDLDGNKIDVKRLEFPSLTKRKRGEAQKEADELGINVATLRMRRWVAKQPSKPKKERVLVTHCKNGHPYSGENLYELNGKRHCKQCKRDSKARKKTQC